MRCRVAHEGERRRRVVARLHLGPAEIDAAAIDARRCTGFQAAHRQVQFAQPCCKRHRRRVAHAPGLEVFQAYVHQPGQKRAGGQHHRAAAEHDAELGLDADDAIAVEQQVVNRLLENREIGLVFEALADCRLVQHSIGLRTGGAYRRTLGGIEGAKLDAGFVGGQCHRTAERVDLLDQMPLADATDRRIARHRPQGFDVVRQQQRLHAHARGGERRFGAGVTATDNDDFERFREFHDGRHSTRCRLRFHVKHCAAGFRTGEGRGSSHGSLGFQRLPARQRIEQFSLDGLAAGVQRSGFLWTGLVQRRICQPFGDLCLLGFQRLQ